MDTFRKVRTALSGSWSSLLIGLNTIVCSLALFPLTALRLLAPLRRWRDGLRQAAAGVAEAWIAFNSRVIARFRRTRWQTRIDADLSPEASYVVNCNHQSWADILVLQRLFNRRAPLMRFFIKQQLIWVPVLGAAWWALDFPFMRRYTRAQVERDPSLRGRDLESARRACEKFREIPVTFMNFMEGTRFTPEKHAAQESPYDHLLKPRAGGLGQVLYSMNHRLKSMIDVTIVYPDGSPSFWELVSGQVSRIVVTAREIRIPERLQGVNFRANAERRKELEAWIAGLWKEKDRQIGAILRGDDPAAVQESGLAAA